MSGSVSFRQLSPAEQQLRERRKRKNQKKGGSRRTQARRWKRAQAQRERQQLRERLAGGVISQAEFDEAVAGVVEGEEDDGSGEMAGAAAASAASGAAAVIESAVGKEEGRRTRRQQRRKKANQDGDGKKRAQLQAAKVGRGKPRSQRTVMRSWSLFAAEDASSDSDDESAKVGVSVLKERQVSDDIEIR